MQPIHVISTGAGVQSSTLTEMACTGEIAPKPLCGIFADTQAEPQSVYDWLDYLTKRATFPIYRVTAGSLTEKELQIRRSKKSGKLYRSNKIPTYTDTNGKAGMNFRMCTLDFKIKPIIRKLRELAKVKRGCKEIKVIQWIGISTDEAGRMKPSRVPWIENRYPLIEKNMSRRDCIQYFEERGLPKPPRSACVYCPYHNDAEWIRLKDKEPKAFADAVSFEKRLQEAAAKSEVSTAVPFLHRSLVPLDQVEFKRDHQTKLFTNECEGMCGV